MNDPGLDDPISNHADNVEQEMEDVDEQQMEEEAYLEPSRWWFASTAFPLIAGTFGPMASAFNLCALVQHWRVTIDLAASETEENGQPVPDPPWLIAVNAVSLVLAIIANMALLMNMTRRLSFTIAQPITIVGWYISSILLIGLVIAAGVGLQLPGQDRALSEAYYYAIMAAVLYFLISCLMVITVWGAYKEHYPKEFELTISQRTLMLQTISFMVYLLGGAAVYMHLEGWAFLDAVYFADFTLLTVGIGDYTPATHTGRGLLFPFAIGGIIIIGLVIGSIRSLVLERGKQKLGERMIEKHRERVVKKLWKSSRKEKLIPVGEHEDVNSTGKSERERREDEFHLMRKIQRQASQRRKWVALAISGSAWLGLWLIGAVVFYKAERNQGWTYFQSVYFAYTSLLTIGYGDFRPKSNSGKPFFVFWSLLAVPTLTILISNMGDTVVAFVRDWTIYIGEVTFLPGESKVTHRLKYAAKKLTRGKITTKGPLMEETPGFISEKANDDSEKQSHAPGLPAANRLAKDEESEELQEANKAKDRGDTLSEDIHYWHYLLIKELRHVMGDLNQSPPKQYTYKEWAWFLKLIGEDEASSRFHRAPPAKVESNAVGEHQLQKTRNEDGQPRAWSWLGYRSPLLGGMEEAEWILEKLSFTLETKLKRHHENQQADKPPVTQGSDTTIAERPNGPSQENSKSK